MVVEQDEVGLQLLRPPQRLAGVAGVAHDRELRVLREQRGESPPEQRVIVDDQDADLRLRLSAHRGQCTAIADAAGTGTGTAAVAGNASRIDVP